jgi:hypothetical protein
MSVIFVKEIYLAFKIAWFLLRFKVIMAASMKITTSWDIAPCSLFEADRCLMMEAVRTSRISVCFKETTRHYIPESWFLHLLVEFLSLLNNVMSRDNRCLEREFYPESPQDDAGVLFTQQRSSEGCASLRQSFVSSKMPHDIGWNRHHFVGPLSDTAVSIDNSLSGKIIFLSLYLCTLRL